MTRYRTLFVTLALLAAFMIYAITLMILHPV
jgi:hypothetical protein